MQGSLHFGFDKITESGTMHGMRYFFTILMFTAFFLPLSAKSEWQKLTLRKKERYPESASLYLPKEDKFVWKRAHQSSLPDKSFAVCEYIPEDQILKEWQEMVSITFSSDTEHTIPELLAITKAQVFGAHRHSHVTWTIHKATENDAIYEWSIPKGHYRMAPQVHLVRLIKSENGAHSLVYSKKSPQIDDEARQDWMDYFSLGKVE